MYVVGFIDVKPSLWYCRYMNRVYQIWTIIFLCLTALVVAGCGKADSPQSAAPSAPPQVVEVRLGYFPNLTHAQAVLGVASGDFQTAIAPANLSTKVFNAGPSLIEALLAGAIDIGYVGPGPVLDGWAETHGKEFVVISGAADNGVVIVAGPKSGIKTMADLAGKKIATPQRGNTQDIAARHYVSEVLKLPVDNIVPISNPEQAGRMLAGDIDAAWAPEPWGSRLVATAGGTIIEEEKNLWPDQKFNLTVVIARQAFVKDHPDIVRKFLAAHHQWTVKLAADPKAYASQLGSALFDLTKAKLPDGVLQQSLGHIVFTDDPSQATFDTMKKWSVDLGVIKHPIPLDGLIDTSILHSLPPLTQ
jgi:NitT/TauT family transport system substrate-binding protein